MTNDAVQSPFGLPRPRVLVVDDEKSIRTTLRAFLEGAGCEVETAADAAQALTVLAKKGPWTVMVSDVILPGVSGVELLKAIKRVAPDIQVIMMTGEPTAATAAESVRAGAHDYLFKPVSKSAILRSVAAAVKCHRLGEEERRLAKDSVQYQRTLEELVAKRTRALEDSNQRLESALSELQRSQEEIIRQERLSALGQMISGIAHDFNNALMPVVGLSDYFLSNPLAIQNPDEFRADLQAIQSSALAAADVVRRLREFYRPDEELGTSTVDLARLVLQVIQLTEPAWKIQAGAEGREIYMVNNVRSSMPIQADEPRLREALVNLTLNAVHAMPTGGILRFDAESADGFVTIRIADTGTGMTEDVRNRCFEPFFTTKGRSGTGLGLAMVYGIVTRHGGQITVESAKNQGTTFTIRLPVTHQPSETPPAESSVASGGEHPRLKVLVVDDEDPSRLLIGRFLRSRGHEVVSASTGQEAMEAFRREPVDLVIADRAIPDVSGDHIAADVKQLSPRTPVIMLTGFGEIMNIRGEKPAGVDCVLGKPVTADQLQATVLRTMASTS